MAYTISASSPNERGNTFGRYEREQRNHPAKDNDPAGAAVGHLLPGVQHFQMVMTDDGGRVAVRHPWDPAAPTFTLGAYPNVRLLLGGGGADPQLYPMTDWLGTDPTKWIGAFTIDADGTLVLADGTRLPPGQCVFWADMIYTPGVVKRACTMFSTGAAPAAGVPTHVWVGPNKFDFAWSHVALSDMPVKLTHTGGPFLQTRKRLVIPKTVVPWAPRPTPAPSQWPAMGQMWADRLSVSVKVALVRRPVRSGKGYPSSCVRQEYHYYDAVHANENATDAGTWITSVDGPAGVGMPGMIVSGQVGPTPALAGLFYVSTAPAHIGYIHLDGRKTTIAGHITIPMGDDFTTRPPTTVPTAEHGYWEDGSASSTVKLIGTWVDGSSPGFAEPWDVQYVLARFLPGDPHPEEYIVADTLKHRLVHVDHRPAHAAAGAQPECRTLATFPLKIGTAAGEEPWACPIGPDGRAYVTCFRSHRIYAVDLTTGVKEVIVDSLFKPSLTDIGTTRGQQQSAFTDAVLAARYSRDGGPGLHSLPFPQAARFDSTGKLIVANRYLNNVYEVDVATKVVRLLFHVDMHDKGYDVRDVSIDVNASGTTGPLDSIRWSGWYVGTQNHYTRAGGWIGQVYQEQGARDLTRGPFDRWIGGGYIWAMASGFGYLYLGQVSAAGVWRLRWRQGEAAPPSNYGLGLQVYMLGGVSGGPVRPSFYMSHGVDGQGQFAVGHTFDDMAGMTDADLGAYIQSGMGTPVPRPEITGTNLAALMTYIRWNGTAVGEGEGPPPPTMTYFGASTYTITLGG